LVFGRAGFGAGLVCGILKRGRRMQRIEIDGAAYELKLGVATRERLRAAGAVAGSEFGADLDVTRLIDENSRVAEFLSSSEDYVIAVAAELLLDQSQREAFRAAMDSESLGQVYDAVVAELLGFTLPPKRPAVVKALRLIGLAMEAAINDAFSDLLPISTEKSGESLEPLESIPATTACAN
jgi:hypothetical protein